MRSLARVLGLISASIVSLYGGAILAVGLEGPPRVLVAVSGFGAYLLFMGRALRVIPIPEAPDSHKPGPDGELKRGDVLQSERRAAAAAVLSAVFAFEGGVLAQPTAPLETTPTHGIQLHGFVDAYAAWNPNQPSDRDNFEPGTGTTAEKANQFGLNLATLDISLDADPVGFHVVGVAGTGTDVVHASELHPDRVRYVYQASVSYRLDAGRGVLLEIGIQPSHIGYEGFFSKDNWNYTRGWMGEFSPYYQTGLKIATTFDTHWSGQLWLLNGWQSIEDNNNAKAFGTQVAYAKDVYGVTVNTFFGPELPEDSSHWRSFVDLVGTLKISSRVNAAASVDLGRQARPQAAAADWQGASIWLRYLLSSYSSSSSSPSSALAVRVEYFHDPDAAVSPVSQSLFGSTLTFELRPHPQLLLKLEARYDHSSADAFGGPDGPLTKHDEFLLVLGAVATF